MRASVIFATLGSLHGAARRFVICAAALQFCCSVFLSLAVVVSHVWEIRASSFGQLFTTVWALTDIAHYTSRRVRRNEGMVGCAPTRFAQAAFQFIQHFLIQRTLDWHDARDDTDPQSVAWGLLVAYELVHLGTAVSYAPLDRRMKL
ncbi:unnamed protein product [Penicillium palitans]